MSAREALDDLAADLCQRLCDMAGEPRLFIPGEIKAALMASDALAAIRAEALREAADEMEAVISDGDVAEVAAPVSGEVGRSAAVARRDALYEEPHEWLRQYARAALVDPAREAGGR